MAGQMLIQHPDTGEERIIPQGQSYRPPWVAKRVISQIEQFQRENSNLVGLGDLVALLLKIIGIKKKKGCGCNNRQKSWNRFRVPIPIWVQKLINRGLTWR